jgi:hypothetical protein
MPPIPLPDPELADEVRRWSLAVSSLLAEEVG